MDRTKKETVYKVAISGVDVNSVATRSMIACGAVVVAIAFFFCSCDRPEAPFSSAKTGPPQVGLKTELISEKQLRVEVTVPQNHHLYLDRGVEGNLIPISFDWRPHIAGQNLTEEPRLLSAPAGEKDKKVKATVLRGRDAFIFESSSLQKLSGKNLRVRIQICDEIQGLCYRPEWKEVLIR